MRLKEAPLSLSCLKTARNCSPHGVNPVVCALRGGAKLERGDAVELSTVVVRKGQWRLAAPMYDVGCTMYD